MSTANQVTKHLVSDSSSSSLLTYPLNLQLSMVNHTQRPQEAAIS